MKNRIAPPALLVFSAIILLSLAHCGSDQPKSSKDAAPQQMVDSTQKVATNRPQKDSVEPVVEDMPYDANTGKKVRIKDHTTKFSPLYSSFYQATPRDMKRYYHEPLDMILTDEGTDASILNYYANEFKPKYRNYIWIKVRYKTKMIDGQPVEQMTYDHKLILREGARH